MEQNYTSFYRRNGLRTQAQIVRPPMHDIKTLELPFNSIYHYVSYDGVELGPASNDYLFRNIKKPIVVGHVLELGDSKGSPRRNGMNMLQMVRDYHVQHRRFRLMRQLESVDRDMQTLVVYNYCLLSKGFRYIHSFYSEYFKWNNVFASVVENIVKTTQISQRQHFLMAGSPKVIPSLSQLNLATEGLNDSGIHTGVFFGMEDYEHKSLTVAQETMTQALLKAFRDKEAFLLMELWKWLGDKRQESLLSKIPDNKLHLINIIFQETGQWTVVNLGQLNAYRKYAKGVINESVIQSKQVMEPVQLQKRVLRMYMSVMEARTVVSAPEEQSPENSAVSEQETEHEINDGSQSDEQYIQKAIDSKEVLPQETHTAQSTDLELDSLEELDDEQIMSDGENLTPEQEKEKLRNEDLRLDEDLAQLNEIARRQEQDAQAQEQTLQQTIYQTKGSTLSEGVMNTCDRLADEGLLSAAEYRRFTKLANTFKELPAPLGKKGTLQDFIHVPAEILKITHSPDVPDAVTVIDKSMLKSSLLSFDSRYITNVLDKDIAAMAMAIQHAGIAVTDYKVDKEDNILGSYHWHTVKLNPVVGQQSTIRFKLPVVDADGTYMSNGVKYVLRKQRGD